MLNSTKFQRLIKVFLLIIGFGLLILFSELIFTYNNRSSYIAKFYIFLAETEVNKGNLNNAINYLDKAATLFLNENRIYYKEKIPNLTIRNEFRDLNEKTKQEIYTHLIERLPNAKGEKSILLVSNIYYNLGLILYSAGQQNSANSFFLTAIYLHPELSFLFVELANSYFNSGYSEKGVEILKYCLEFEFPIKHCNDYLENNVKTKSFETVGTFREIIPKYQSLN